MIINDGNETKYALAFSILQVLGPRHCLKLGIIFSIPDLKILAGSGMYTKYCLALQRVEMERVVK
jgi:hypothetical protein